MTRRALRGPGEQSREVEAELFLPVTDRGIRVYCWICGTSGFPGGDWQRPHRKGHAPCLECGKQLTVKIDGTPRKHARCPAK